LAHSRADAHGWWRIENNKFRVQVRRNGTYQSRTFDSIRAAEDWQGVEDKTTVEGIIDQKTARRTTLARAGAWMVDGNHSGSRANAKNVFSKLRYWQESRFDSWALPTIHDWDLIECGAMFWTKIRPSTEKRLARTPSARHRLSCTFGTKGYPTCSR
jgi:hypothetical protein